MNDSERKEMINARLSSSPRRLDVWIQAWRFGTYRVSLRLRGRRRDSGAKHKREETLLLAREFVTATFWSYPFWSGSLGVRRSRRRRAGPVRSGGAESGRARREGKRASPSGASFYLPKTFSYSCSMSSTIWFW